MEKRRFKQNENGAVLLTVLCVMLMMIILVGASISFVSQTTQKTYRTFQAEQAYMTATTCLETYVNDIELKTLDGSDQTKQKKAIDELVALSNDNGGNGYEYDVLINGDKDIEKMGSCTIRVSKFNDQTIVITATAKFGSETDQVAAYVQTDTQPRSASFSNAIEICQDTGGDYNNLKVLGDYATITGNNKSKTYVIANNFQTCGSFIVYGNVKATNNANVTLGAGLNDSTVGGRLQIWGNFYAENTFTAQTTMNKAETNDDNYMLIKGEFKCKANPVIGDFDAHEADNESKDERENKKEIDVFCENFYCETNNYKQLGNLVVSGKDSSTFKYYGTTAYIYGDLVVDGKFDLGSSSKIEVHGNVYCSGDIPSNVVCVGYNGKGSEKKLNQKFPNQAVPTTGRFKVPEMSATYNEYEYYPEDLIASTNSTVGVLKNKYNALHSSTTPTSRTLYDAEFGDGVAAFSYTYNGTKVERVNDDGAHIRVTESDGTVSDYAMVVNKSCIFGPELGQDNATEGLYKIADYKTLIHVTNEDIVILLKPGVTVGDGKFRTFIVKNDSPASNPHYCYFVTDAGETVFNDTERDMTKTVRSKNQKVTFDLHNSSIMDYDLYKRLYNTDTLKSYKQSLKAGVTNPNFALNLTSSEIAGTYMPPEEKIIYLLTYGSTFKMNNDSFHQGIIYGPEANYYSSTQSYVKFPKIYYSSIEPPKENTDLCSLGMVITGSFYNKNSSSYAFNEPDANSALSIVKKAKNSQLSGYKLIRYEHH